VEKGELVRVRLLRNWMGDEWDEEWGVVVDYRPNILGGSAHISSGIINTPLRGEVLILSYKDGGMSWFDERNVYLVREGV